MSIRIDKYIVVLALYNFFVYIAYGMSFSFFPIWASQHIKISEKLVGIIFAFYPIGAIGISALFAKMMFFWGKIFLLQLTQFGLFLSMLAFGSLYWTKSKYTFIPIAIISRFFTGIGVGGYSSIADSYMPMLYPNNAMQMISIMQTAVGLGYALGPIVGGFFYQLGGYLLPFIVFASIFLFAAILIPLMLPNDKSASTNEKPLELKKFLFNTRYGMSCLLLVFQGIGDTFIQPTISGYLQSTFNLSSLIIGLIFSLCGISYMIFVPLLQLFPKTIPKGFWMMLGIFITSLGCQIIGPSFLVNVKPQIYFSSIGCFLLGAGDAFIYNPIIPYLIEISYDINYVKQNNCNRDRLCEMSAGFFQAFYGLAELIGPICGGFLVEYIGFRKTSSIISFSQWAYIILFIIFARGYQEILKLFYSTKQKQQLLEKLIESEQEISQFQLSFKGSIYISSYKKQYQEKQFDIQSFKNISQQQQQQS